MQDLLREFASWVALACDLASVLCAGSGAVDAVVRICVAFGRGYGLAAKKDVFVHFASWIVLSLEFALAADIVDTAITPSWDDIGRLAAIAAIRTFLNYFLSRDLDAAERARAERAARA